MRAVGDAGAALIAAPPPTASPLFPTPAAVLGTSGAPAPSTGAPSDAVEWWSVNRHSTHSAPLTLSAARALTLDHCCPAILLMAGGKSLVANRKKDFLGVTDLNLD